MEFQDWEPVYREILADFGYDRAGDERSRDVIAALVHDTYDPGRMQLTDRTVAIVGAAGSLADDHDAVRSADRVLAASTAADHLLAAGLSVDCVVTDLDKHPEAVPSFTNAGIPVAVHAHGDNQSLVERHVPDCDHEYVLPTTQARPVGPVRNFGGFTDGDRAAFLADHFGAAELTFPGWDFEDVSETVKTRKLAWAERLLYWLERRRDERFPVLDGRRGTIDTTALPVE